MQTLLTQKREQTQPNHRASGRDLTRAKNSGKDKHIILKWTSLLGVGLSVRSLTGLPEIQEKTKAHLHLEDDQIFYSLCQVLRNLPPSKILRKISLLLRFFSLFIFWMLAKPAHAFPDTRLSRSFPEASTPHIFHVASC